MSNQNIHIGGNAQGNAFGDGSRVTNINSFNHCADPAAAERELAVLKTQVAELVAKLPADKKDEAPQVAENLEMLVKQATSDKPNRKWYSLSAEGLLEASAFVKNFTGNIAGTIGNLGKAIWGDFTLPG